jgi:2-haloacid dehalogenase
VPLPEEGVRAQPDGHQLGSNVAPIIVLYGCHAFTPNSAPMTYVSPATEREIKAVLFDTFGTVVDWRSGVAREVAAFAKRHQIDVDAAAFADAWRAKYEPSMEPIRDGSRDFVPLDQLHLENLHAALEEFGLDAARFDDRELGELNAAWERLDPWEDSVAGLTELGRHVIVGPLSNANLALLLRMALRARLPWTVIVGSDATRAYKPTLQAYRNMAWMLRLDPGEVMLAAAHNCDLTSAQRAGLGTAFIPRPTELGAGQTKDLTAEGDWDLVCASILDLATSFADA